MSLFEEKRRSNDRRVRNDGPPPECRERRSKRDRRQTVISEISFHEWTRYFLRFKKRASVKAEIRAKEPAAGQASSSSRTVSDARIVTRRDDDDPDAHSTTPTISS
jgi:hypothetical protein